MLCSTLEWAKEKVPTIKVLKKVPINRWVKRVLMIKIMINILIFCLLKFLNI